MRTLPSESLETGVSILKKWTLVLLASLGLLVGCQTTGNTTTAGAGLSGQFAGGAGNNGLSGRITYERPTNTPTNGWDFNNLNTLPVRNAKVEIINSTNDAVVDTVVTDNNGNFTATLPTVIYRVRVYAESTNPPIRIQDNTNNDAIHTMESPVIQPAQTVVNLHAVSGFNTDGSLSGGPRVAGPFAILDDVLTAEQAFLAARPGIVFTALKINFSILNTNALIGTSSYNPRIQQVSILGDAGVDSDEFDSHVIVHEWGHFYEDTLSRTESIGGPHTFGDVLEIALAFGEGWGNALAGIILNNPQYSDAFGANQASSFGFDLQNNTVTNPGWFSEFSCQALLFDLFDNDVEAFDMINLTLGDIHDAMVNQRNTTALTSVFSFMNTLQATFPAQQANFNTLLAANSITGPVADDFGTTEANDGGNPNFLPVYPIQAIDGVGVGYTLEAASNNEINKKPNNIPIRFVGNGAQVTITTTGNQVIFDVLRNGVIVAEGLLVGNQNVSLITNNGETYIIRLQGQSTGASFTSTVTLTSP